MIAASSLSQKVSTTSVVLALHLGALWGLQYLPPPESTIPAPVKPPEVVAIFVTPSAPEPEPPAQPAPPQPPPPEPAPPPPPPPPVPPPPPKPKPKLPKPQKTVQKPTPAPVQMPLPTEEVATQEDSSAAPTSSVSSAKTKPATSASASTPAVVLPSSQASYLRNPRPTYPPISRRMGEQGKVMLRVLVSAQGLPQQIELLQSSGYPRLDKAAMQAVQRWKFTPGTRAGVPEAMWNNVPVSFVLE